MLRPLGQPPIDLTGFTCLSSDVCKSGGDPSLMCCGSIPGAPGGTCRAPAWCSEAGYQEFKPGFTLPTQPEPKESSVLEQIVIGVAVAVGVGFILQSLSKGKRYTMNPGSKRSKRVEAEVRLLMRWYGLTLLEARDLSAHPRQREILDELDDWRGEHGLPARSSPMVRGKLLELMR